MATACDEIDATLSTAIEKVRTDWNAVDVAVSQKLADFIIDQDNVCDAARLAQSEALNKYVNDKLAEFDLWSEGER